MHCTNYVPGYYYPRDHVVSLRGNSRTITHSDIAWNSARGFNLAFPPFLIDQEDFLRQKEILRQTVLKHEATFRYQVNELHRLYGRQRELMDEIKRRKLVEDHIHLQALEPNTFVSPLKSEISEKTFRHSVNRTSIKQYAPSKEMFEALGYSANRTTQPGADCFSGQNILNKCKASTLKNTSRKRILDLELPEEKAIDNENPAKKTNVLISKLQPQCSSKVNFVISGGSSSSSSSCRGTFLLFDLNEPVQPFESVCPNSAFGSNTIHEEIRDRDLDLSGRDASNLNSFDEKEDKFSDYISSGKGMDLNLKPPTNLSDSQSVSSYISHLNIPEGGNVEIHRNSEVLNSNMVPDSTPENRKCTTDNYLEGARIDRKLSTTNISIDLNSCIREDLLSSNPSEATKSTAERDLEGPVSPENKECSPPRGDFQDIKNSISIHLPRRGHNDPIEELDRVAADILIFIASSAKTAIGEPSEASRNCLHRLAEVATSLASSHFKAAKEKEEGTALCYQPQRTKDQKDLQTDVVPAVESLLHKVNETNTAPKSGPWKKIPSRTSSRGKRLSKSNDGERTLCSLLLQHTLDNKLVITGRFLKGWGVTKRRKRARRAHSYMSPLLLADE